MRPFHGKWTDLDVQLGNIPQRTNDGRAPINHFPHPCVGEECDPNTTTKYERSTPTNDQRTQTLFYKAKGKYSMREYIYRIPNIGLTPICLSFFLQTLETNLYLNDPVPCRQPQRQFGGHDPSTLCISLQLVVPPLQLSFRVIGIHNAWFNFFRMLLQSLACARY